MTKRCVLPLTFGIQGPVQTTVLGGSVGHVELRVASAQLFRRRYWAVAASIDIPVAAVPIRIGHRHLDDFARHGDGRVSFQQSGTSAHRDTAIVGGRSDTHDKLTGKCRSAGNRSDVQ